MKKKTKKLDDYKHSHPDELSLFELTDPEKRQYSNTIEFYDALPKYVWRIDKSQKNVQLQPLKREFKHKGESYSVSVSPAWIEQPDGTYKQVFAGQREELVEDALRKLACEGKGIFLDNDAGVVFTLYELEQELKRMGHGYNKNKIKEAIIVCGKSNIEVKSKDGKAIFLSNFFEAVGLQTQEDWKGHGKKSKAFIRFNSLVTDCIRKKTFRLLNYDKVMSYKNILARWLHKRLSHNYTQASLTSPFNIKLSTIIRDSGVSRYKKLTDNVIQVKKALDEMEEKKVLCRYEVQQVIDGRKLLDASFILWPDPSFTAEVKLANMVQKEMLGESEEAFIENEDFF